MRNLAPAADDWADEDHALVFNPSGTGDFVLACEHASNFVPPEFDHLGLPESAFESHIAWDPGALQVAQIISAVLDAPLIAPAVSRLVYDCNRPPTVKDAVPEKSETYDIPGNKGLDSSVRQARSARFYTPFRETLAATIERRLQAGGEPVVMTIHSFVPVYRGEKREMDLGIIHDADSRLADAYLREARRDNEYRVIRNKPYSPEDGVTHTLAVHALSRGLLNVMIEIRNDLIATEADQRVMARRLASYATRAVAAITGNGAAPPGPSI
ncbi:MAG: N-formylglutamate amidohydrolase [Rhodospirillales bacterium]|nr:N-formylglutamate amidohydrolase [Rhodospirillales bacterium]